MGGLESLSTSFILWLQSFSTPALDSVFRLITFFGDEKFYLVLLPLVYWCVDKRLGIRLALLVLASNTINLWLKYACGLARPDPAKVRYIAHQDGPGFPSGHTQSATTAFGYLGSQARRRAWLGGAIMLFLLVGLSRLYLGVHHLYDVLGGLVLGGLLVLLFVRGLPAAERWWGGWPCAARYAAAAGLPIVLFAVWPVEGVSGSLGALCGFAVGALIEVERVRFVSAGAPPQRVLRFLLGFAFVAVLYFGLSAVPIEGEAWRFVRYAAVGLFASAGAPWLFVRLRLAGAEAPAVQAAAQPGS